MRRSALFSIWGRTRFMQDWILQTSAYGEIFLFIIINHEIVVWVSPEVLEQYFYLNRKKFYTQEALTKLAALIEKPVFSNLSLNQPIERSLTWIFKVLFLNLLICFYNYHTKRSI